MTEFPRSEELTENESRAYKAGVMAKALGWARGSVKQVASGSLRPFWLRGYDAIGAPRQSIPTQGGTISGRVSGNGLGNTEEVPR